MVSHVIDHEATFQLLIPLFPEVCGLAINGEGFTMKKVVIEIGFDKKEVTYDIKSDEELKPVDRALLVAVLKRVINDLRCWG